MQGVVTWVRCLIWAVAALPLLAPTAGAQTAAPGWPQRSVKIITPLPPGTGVDFTARMYAEQFARRWGQSVVVENRVGADGIAAASSFVAARDDHALLLTIGAPFTTATIGNDKLPYNPAIDVTPIGLASEQYLAMAVTSGLKAATLAEFEALGRSEAGKLNWAATTGLPHLSFLAFLQHAGLEMANVTYRDAATPLNDLGEGRIQVYLSGYATIVPQLQSGKARLMVMLGRDRNPQMPDVPTVQQAGYPHMTVNGFLGMFGWKGMTDALRDRIAEDMKAVASDSAIVQRFSTAGMALRFGAADELSRMLEDQRGWAGPLLRKK